MSFWDFADKSPYLAVIVIFIAACAAVGVAGCIGEGLSALGGRK